MTLTEFDQILGLDPEAEDQRTTDHGQSGGPPRRSWVKNLLGNVFSSSASDVGKGNTEQEISKMIRSVSANSDSAGEFPEHKGNGKTEKNYWMSDSSVKNCFDCGKSFSTIRRRHHCRFCGQIFCWKCAPVRAPERDRKPEAINWDGK